MPPEQRRVRGDEAVGCLESSNSRGTRRPAVQAGAPLSHIRMHYSCNFTVYFTGSVYAAVGCSWFRLWVSVEPPQVTDAV